MLVHSRRVLLAILLALCALPAAAHDHPSPGAGSETAAGEFKAAHVWSKPCPAAPGQLCCCGGWLALAGAGKVLPVDAPAWSSAVARPAGAQKFSDSSVLALAPQPSHRARPRAPPLPS